MTQTFQPVPVPGSHAAATEPVAPEPVPAPTAPAPVTSQVFLPPPSGEPLAAPAASAAPTAAPAAPAAPPAPAEPAAPAPTLPPPAPRSTEAPYSPPSPFPTGEPDAPDLAAPAPPPPPPPAPAPAPPTPPVRTGPVSVVPLLRALVESGGSDLHCKVGSPPRVRVDGVLRRLQVPDLRMEDTEHFVREVLRPDLIEEFARTNEADFAYGIDGVGRFRVNVFRQRGSAGLVFRRVSIGAIPLEDLGLPQVLAPLSLEPRGLVLVTGPTGSGKTTTLAGMVDHINSHRDVHVVTIEDPIEVLHHDKRAMINQREVRVDTDDFNVALRAAMRQDPDVILVGEMRDQETVKAALSAAETGHFVMSTLHTTDAQETIARVIDFFAPHEQHQVRLALAGALRGILCQRLVQRADGLGRCVAMEVLINTGRVAEAIADPDKTSSITSLLAEGGFYGMQTFDQHLTALFRDGVITLDAALGASSSPHDLMVELRRLGLVA